MQLALATLIGMPLIAILIDRFSESVDIAASVIGFVSWWIQIVAGISVGLLIAFIAQKIIETPMLQKVNSRYANMLGRFELSFNIR